VPRRRRRGIESPNNYRSPQNVFAELVDMLGICRRTGLPLTNFCVVLTGVFFTHSTAQMMAMTRAMPTPKRLTLRFNVVHAEDNFSWHQGWFSALALERERLGGETSLSGTDAGYNEGEKRVTKVRTRIVTSGA